MFTATDLLADIDLLLEELEVGDVLLVHGFKAAESEGVGLELRAETALEGFELGEGLHGSGWGTEEWLDARPCVALRRLVSGVVLSEANGVVVLRRIR